jgi:hypothetical protein
VLDIVTYDAGNIGQMAANNVMIPSTFDEEMKAMILSISESSSGAAVLGHLLPGKSA